MNWFGLLPSGSEGFEYHLLVIALALGVVTAPTRRASIRGNGAALVWSIRQGYPGFKRG
jgi:hypothetical protein